MSDGGNTTTVTTSGTGTLVLGSASDSLNGTTFFVGGNNKLMLVANGGAWGSQGGARISLANGAVLQLAAADTTAANYDLAAQNVTSGQNVAYSAGMDFAGQGGAVSGGAVNLSNGSSAFSIPNGQTLGFSANSGYTLNVLSPVNNASGGTLNDGGLGAPGGQVNMTLNNSAGAMVAPTSCDFILSNLQSLGQFSPQGTGGVTFTAGFNGNLSQLTPAPAAPCTSPRPTWP